MESLTSTFFNEEIHTMEVPLCILCGKRGLARYTNLTDRLFKSPGFYSIMECPICSLLWLSPRPNMEDIQKIYPQSSNNSSSPDISKYNKMRNVLKNALLASKFHYKNLPSSYWQIIVSKVISIFIPLQKKVELSVMYLDGHDRGRLLDIGCSTGEFLVRMRELGWEVYGVDINKNAVRIAQDHNKLDVINGTLEQACFPDDTFDAVTMSHVIEHVADPLQTLKESYRILKPGGKLVVITPNMHSLCHKIYKSAYYHLDIPRHLYIYSTKSIKFCAEMAGLKILRLSTFARAVGSTWQASREIQKNGKLDGYYTGRGKGFYPNIIGNLLQGLENVVSRLNDIGEEIVMIATTEKGHKF